MDMRMYPSMKNLYEIHKIPNIGRMYKLKTYELPLFSDLRYARWEVTEKIDGTNIRIGWDGAGNVSLTGRENKNSRLPGDETGVPELLESTFTVDRFMAGPHPHTPMVIFCEAFGPKIGKYGHLYGDEPALAVLDVLINGWWLERTGLNDVASMFSLSAAPLLDDYIDLPTASDLVMRGLRSQFGEFWAEGVVARPAGGILDRRGHPIRLKIKREYFAGKGRVIND